MTIAAPADYHEFIQMLDYAVLKRRPIAIRYPRGTGKERLAQAAGRGTRKRVRILEGEDVTIVAVGRMTETALKVAGSLSERGIRAEVINARFVKPLDEQLIADSVLRDRCAGDAGGQLHPGRLRKRSGDAQYVRGILVRSKLLVFLTGRYPTDRLTNFLGNTGWILSRSPRRLTGYLKSAAETGGRITAAMSLEREGFLGKRKT